jgi:hypothetical protein
MESNDIIRAIDAYAERSGLKPSTICQYAVRNWRLYDELSSGRECLPRTARRLMAWIHDNPPSHGLNAK